MRESLDVQFRRVYDYLQEKELDVVVTWRSAPGTQNMVLCLDCPNLSAKFMASVVESEVKNIYPAAYLFISPTTEEGSVRLPYSESFWNEMWDDRPIGDLIDTLGGPLFNQLFSRFKAQRIELLEGRQ
jgi:hypothetical protein